MGTGSTGGEEEGVGDDEVDMFNRAFSRSHLTWVWCWNGPALFS